MLALLAFAVGVLFLGSDRRATIQWLPWQRFVLEASDQLTRASDFFLMSAVQLNTSVQCAARKTWSTRERLFHATHPATQEKHRVTAAPLATPFELDGCIRRDC